MSTAIKFENISKQYRLGLVSTQTLSHDLNRWWQTNIRGKEDPYLKIGDVNDRSKKGESDYVWALKDINFEVQQGDVLGIIGKNGAGKSTLLKILSKVTAPTTGTIKAAGRIASLLEVGTGFHPEMTGRENIYMNGAIMGMTKAEITRKLDEIIDFSGVERYIDTPAKRYSSGMTVRLGFAIAAHLDPEILVVDEVLAVGDAEFQKKAIGKMQDISKGEGRTVLFVSHNMGAVRSLCKTGIVLKDGYVSYAGIVDGAIDHYFETKAGAVGAVYENLNKESTDIINIKLTGIDDETKDIFRFEEFIIVNFELNIDAKLISSLCLGVSVFDKFERKIFNENLNLKELINEGGTHRIKMKIPHSFLVPNFYKVTAGLHIPNQRFVGNRDASVDFVVEDTGSQYFMYQGSNIGCVNANSEWIIF